MRTPKYHPLLTQQPSKEIIRGQTDYAIATTGMEDTERRVWMLARELSFTTWFPPLADTSDGKFHLSHWAVLITSSNVSEHDFSRVLVDGSKSDKAVLGCCMS